jgi:hypothetical protein
MWNALMIVSMLSPLFETQRGPQSVSQKIEPTNTLIISGKISKGMTKDEIDKNVGQPSSRYEKPDGRIVYQFDGDLCEYEFKSCQIWLDQGKVSNIFDVKPAYLD